MKICLAEFAGRGGIAYYTRALAQALVSTDMDVQLITTKNYALNTGRRDHLNTLQLFTPHYHYVNPVLKGLIYGRSVAQLVRRCRLNKPDVLHLQQSRIPVLERWWFRMLQKQGIAVVLTPHEVFGFGNNRLSRTSKQLYQQMNGLIIHTHSGTEILRKEGIPEKLIYEIPHGSYSQYVKTVERAEARERLSIRQEEFVLLAFGHVRYSKGIDSLVDAVCSVNTDSQKCFLLIAGEEADDLQPLKERLNYPPAANYIRWDNRYIPDEKVADYFAASDIVVLPYRQIDQSGVLFLAAAYAKPVIVTPLPAFTDIIVNGENGYLVSAADSRCLAEKIQQAANEKVNFMSMGEQLQHKVSVLGNWERIADQTFQVYQQACDMVKRNGCNVIDS